MPNITKLVTQHLTTLSQMNKDAGLTSLKRY
ncbi:hypothetical protein HWC97_gp30 [Flavobacterium phage vB_FspS_snusmum6-1]|uniref:Uncharacterized protein n=4 Tax=Caudoviricetes TaxID=2731619 RepID=A0A6B9LI36_9CAUD|nr:hypothetical protein HWC88_gp30 [Flavobacterium phage vB_FspS_hattifnatt9-1]YP_009855313.1 hypothetical protein HWC97_gp30 [Flavobacterium phage vB_FspS_snusmum6-1]QHB40676.1 hypothetical protein snusmum62_gp030 [Flavobacterium phage vB_FspS_snusmum6-2]QHB40749.1 hypothetical protein snusmum63_gp030 [Flavobacterium phage vB_FspS_snusmum6-3]QHB40820.1 hypothetical protein snusmum91_gp029 [Flavobacterium phage vB_FspS_snusmum9-1]QHB38715.1 hypothetical protein hattifnatt91_gp030 [Flavobacteri